LAEHNDHGVVSFDSEKLVLVDPSDREIGYVTKADAHHGAGVLHRAFSLFVFNPAGELLLQQRAQDKRLWGGYWSNSCCSHPRRGETMHEAVQRRLAQELGFTCPLRFVYKFEYQASFGDRGSEHELCWVYAGESSAPVRANRNEVEAWRWITPAALDREIAAEPGRFTPWLKLEWQRLRGEFAHAIEAPALRGAASSG
jgi:isopentenyl-diphosphate delta-isomerase